MRGLGVVVSGSVKMQGAHLILQHGFDDAILGLSQFSFKSAGFDCGPTIALNFRHEAMGKTHGGI
jgi:hypothetical protein